MKILFVFAILFCLFSHCSLKKGGGGGSGGRGGSSGGRSSSIGGRSSGARSGTGFASSSGIRSSGKSRTIAAALGGAAVGYMGARVAHSIGSGGSMYLPSYQRTYYYGNRYYPSNANSYEKLVCRYDIDDDDDIFDLLYDDGSRVSEIVYECNARSEQCCDGLDCCPKSGFPWWAILLIVVIMISLLVCMVVSCVRFINKSKQTNTSEKVNETQISTVQYQPNGYYPPPVGAAPTLYSEGFYPNVQNQQHNFDGFTPTYAQMDLHKQCGTPGYPAPLPSAQTNQAGFFDHQQAPPLYQPQNYPTK